ncbi:hypothetical protein K0B96_05590 [Horticoccus luteus]|uniref:Uncharacterized protein n=1 Tax=Horticoccus luteus TaxID=2862869 RepID=A0A8F9TYI1_9BACT|nr:hypothetical protein [Horticoccus luteus]QYM80088.1 hypothetical protein K0B96_05590 [Horticoccus luteus]
MNGDAFGELQGRVVNLLARARTNHPLGVIAYTPAAEGEAYPALYLRDFTYMAESASEFMPLTEVRAVIALLVAHLSREGLCPERITNQGEVVYVCHGARPAVDSPLFLAKLCAAYARHGGERVFLAAVFSDVCRAVATTPTEIATGLVWVDPAAPHTAYGFTDTIAITGRHLFCSLLLFEACEILAALAHDLERPADSVRLREQAAKIRANLDLLWSPEDNLFFAGSEDCRQADVWGSAYACVIGAVDDARRHTIARTLLDQRERFVLRGQIRHLLRPAFWHRLIVESEWTSAGCFQNGPYWGTATGWLAEVFEMAEPGCGFALLRELVADFAAHGVWECIGPGGYARVANNLSSVCLPYAAWKKLRASAASAR